MGKTAVVIVPRRSLDEPPTPPPCPLAQAPEFVDSSLGFAISRATIGVLALICLILLVVTVPCLT